jgi:hypothetical protein
MMYDALSKLHGFYQPPAPSWRPQTTGWYILFCLIGLLAIWIAWKALLYRRRNRYRRAALSALDQCDLEEIPELLKRTAIAAWPREEVASLTGDPWVQFFGDHLSDRNHLPSAAALLTDLSSREPSISSDDEAQLRKVAAYWIRKHHVRA